MNEIPRLLQLAFTTVEGLHRVLFAVTSILTLIGAWSEQGRAAVRNAAAPLAERTGPIAQPVVGPIWEVWPLACFAALLTGLATVVVLRCCLGASPISLLPREARPLRRRNHTLFLLGLLTTIGILGLLFYLETRLVWAHVVNKQIQHDVIVALTFSAVGSLFVYWIAFGLWFAVLVPLAFRIAGAPWPWRPIYRWMAARVPAGHVQHAN